MQLALNLPNPLAARQALFLSAGGHPFTTSRAVAERFGKRHDTVLRAIQNLRAEIPDLVFWRRNFAASNYRDNRGKVQPEYRLRHDGFALLAMGFTGRDAMAWKIAFLDAFNALEAELLARTARYAHALHQVRPALLTVVEGTEYGLCRHDIGQQLGKSESAVTYHRGQARRLGLLRPAREAA